MSSLFEQSNLTKDRQNIVTNIIQNTNLPDIHLGLNVAKTHGNHELKSNKTLNLILQDKQKKLN